MLQAIPVVSGQGHKNIFKWYMKKVISNKAVLVI